MHECTHKLARYNVTVAPSMALGEEGVEGEVRGNEWQGGVGSAAGKQVRSGGVGDELEGEREEGASGGRVGRGCEARTLYQTSRGALT